MAASGPGRPQRPVSEAVPALAELAQHLRELRLEAGMTLAELAAAAHWSKAALSTATAGESLPKWKLVRAWVEACGQAPNLRVWEARYLKAQAEYQVMREAVRQQSPAPVPANRGGLPPVAPAPADGIGRLERVPEPAPVVVQHASTALERDGWRSLAPDTRAWSVSAHPSPLKLRYTTVHEDIVDPDAGEGDLSGTYDEIAEVFDLAGCRCLLVLGAPGSGKTQLARHLGTKLMQSRRGDGPVPVLVSLSGWHGSEGLEALLEWTAAALDGATAEHVRGLLASGRMLPVFDDFDGVAPGERVPALHALNLLAQQARFVLISDEIPYTEAVVESDSVISGSAGIRLGPVTPSDLDGWIQHGSRQRTKRELWAAVLAHLAAHPGSPAEHVLSDPLLAGAARLLYTDGRADPGELIAPHATAESLERRLMSHLVDTWLPRRMRNPGPDAKAAGQRMHLALRMLASRQEDLGRAVHTRLALYALPPWSRFTAVILSVVVFGWCVSVTSSTKPDLYGSGTTELSSPGILAAVLLGVGTYVYVRRQYAERAGPPSPWEQATPVAAVPGLIPLSFFLQPPYYSLGEAAGVVLTSAVLALAARLHHRRGSRLTPARHLTELLFLAVAFTAVPIGGTGPSQAVLFLIAAALLTCSTVYGHWLRAALTSRLVWMPLRPSDLTAAMDDATRHGFISRGIDHYTFTHRALLHHYRRPAQPASEWSARPQ
ncbi:helix-turn-helix domain-containing protein [Streptomyces genisteinicus]|uniref:Helix-turn-helix domain-containing protein n=1 Tax=Streptomyces genisteinicus TaxID=2768068 RepID=A0A7H0HMC6_9ACTN|nr:helix-turn-helix domain-containing protein [Streptomyces genisteinicus]QNP61692.1 helix-turn-helix domain-containing protein [Streptomyces genisteinicus]